MPSALSLLIVDDDEAFCHALARAMSRRGFEVDIAHSVDHAWRLTETGVPDYAIVDLNLPDGSGAALVVRLRSLSAAIRILVLTGSASPDTAREVLQLGASSVLSKPADADEITAALIGSPTP